MGNPLRNAMVYLGLAEEADNQNDRQGQVAQSTANAETDRVEPVTERATPAPVTPINRASAPHATPVVKPTPAAPKMNEILTVHPKAFDNDAKVIAEHFRDGVPVIMNLSQMSDGDARRIIDFASGLAQGLLGKIERVTNRVFLLTPEHVNVHDDESGQADDNTFFS
ncbi:cell division protein SepF [Gulosibacter hominis]|uniref:cell division protein SepF n=1 Tax=Gulosibacter hominis TaxID=2770504 RepID=UPI0019195E3D|nr:cell division protein SepF [Gulosibacter hominis]